jgi:hypothetical protein
MVRRDGAATRKDRMQEIARNIHGLLAKSSELSLSKTVAMLQYQYGLTEGKITEYLEILESLDHFVVDVERDRIQKFSEGVSNE